MKKVAIIQAGPFRLALDTSHVLKIYPEREGSAEFFGDWQSFKKEQGDGATSITLYALPELLAGVPEDGEGARRLVVLQEAATVAGLMVHAAEPECELSDNLLHPLPDAFPEKCRRYFAHVAVCGDQALPVLTVSALLAMANRGVVGEEEKQ